MKVGACSRNSFRNKIARRVVWSNKRVVDSQTADDWRASVHGRACAWHSDMLEPYRRYDFVSVFLYLVSCDSVNARYVANRCAGMFAPHSVCFITRKYSAPTLKPSRSILYWESFLTRGCGFIVSWFYWCVHFSFKVCCIQSRLCVFLVASDYMLYSNGSCFFNTPKFKMNA